MVRNSLERTPDMKKILLAVLLICATLLSFASCKADPTNSIPTQPGTSTATPSNPADLIGRWYCHDETTVLEFFTNDTMRAYVLTPGYYEYEETYGGVYSYDGTVISYALDNGGSFTSNCSVKDGVATMKFYSTSLVYLKVDALPTQHKTYDFPDFEAIASNATLPSTAITGLTLTPDLKESILSTILEEFCRSESTDPLITEKTEGTAQLGDTVNIDYKGYLDGVQFSGGTASDQRIYVSDDSGYIPGFASAIAGHSVGETFDVNVTFPQNYGSAQLAGKDVVFTMTLNCIYDMDAWVESKKTALLRDEIWYLIPALEEITVPEAAYLYFCQVNLDYLHYYAFYSYNDDYEGFLKAVGVSEEELIEGCKDIGRVYLLGVLISRAYGLTASEDYEADFKEEYFPGKTDKQIEQILTDATELRAYRASLFERLAADYLIANNTFVEAE